MNYILYFFITILSVLFLSSCEKVIDVSVADADKQYVIEGIITNEAEGCQVKISKTKSISETNSFAGVTSAQVKITDENGTATTLTETSTGVYQSSLIGVPGKRYSLQVNIGGKTFSATSQMPQPVSIDSLYVSSMNFTNEKMYYANVAIMDPVEKGNAYRYVQYVNGVKGKDVFLQNDDISNGKKITNSLYGRDNDKLKVGDQIRVELLSIDAAVYKFWLTLSQSATGDGNSASPANPESNINGGALGYFSAQATTSKTVTVE
ncbi:DUF4249 domain-containing protein [Flavisolibacter tropicus]|uniref:DUF4249 domain-containing protein n=1 Tax=Flavisolibacter tropicus TaxID=1492898 RepID=A0A172TVZ0_9BACT|nr:DUF4249 domain-containing protein [Flavisolibacter tropicus]ANE51054.1 hypothetical protein SY85_11620 [Flavisolibacter tropicus]